MRGLISFIMIAALVAGGAGCKRRRKGAPEEPAGKATMLHTADPRAEVQLVRGFHAVEAGAWRWTEKNFAVSLHPPAGAQSKGANLMVKLALPEVLLQKVGPVTVNVKVGGQPLQPETFDSPGDKTYSRAVPASVLGADMVPVEFSLDKAIPPTGQDIRELGVIVSLIGFEAKL